MIRPAAWPEKQSKLEIDRDAVVRFASVAGDHLRRAGEGKVRALRSEAR